MVLPIRILKLVCIPYSHYPPRRYKSSKTCIGDIICIFLGCDRPLVLRPLPNGTFLLVGDSFVYGLHDATALLGPLPSPWRIRVHNHPEHDWRHVYQFFNSDTGISTPEDPRLDPVDDRWERVNFEDLGRGLTGDDPEICDFFRNKVTQEIMDSDPRYLPEALRDRGVQLEEFILV